MNCELRIKEIRKEKGFTQKKLAEKCGMYESQIRKYENGYANPKFETLKKIATALDVQISDLKPGYSFTTVLKDELIEMIQEMELEIEYDDGEENYLDLIMDVMHQKGRYIILYNSLNEMGRDKALEYVEMLHETPKYRKRKKGLSTQLRRNSSQQNTSSE